MDERLDWLEKDLKGKQQTKAQQRASPEFPSIGVGSER
jgi:hypothetical protein